MTHISADSLLSAPRRPDRSHLRAIIGSGLNVRVMNVAGYLMLRRFRSCRIFTLGDRTSRRGS